MDTESTIKFKTNNGKYGISKQQIVNKKGIKWIVKYMVDLVFLTKCKEKEYSTAFTNDLIDNVAYFISSIIKKV